MEKNQLFKIMKVKFNKVSKQIVLRLKIKQKIDFVSL